VLLTSSRGSGGDAGEGAGKAVGKGTKTFCSRFDAVLEDGAIEGKEKEKDEATEEGVDE